MKVSGTLDILNSARYTIYMLLGGGGGVQFEIRFYYGEAKKAPMLEFLNDLRDRQPVLDKLLIAAFEKLKESERHGFPLTRAIKSVPGLFELRVGDADIARVLLLQQ